MFCPEMDLEMDPEMDPEMEPEMDLEMDPAFTGTLICDLFLY